MQNIVCLIGRLLTDIKKNDSKMTLGVQRMYKNENGEYLTDFIDVYIFGEMFKRINEYIKKGDLVAVKGRLEIKDNQLRVIADKLSFLTSNKKEEE